MSVNSPCPSVAIRHAALSALSSASPALIDVWEAEGADRWSVTGLVDLLISVCGSAAAASLMLESDEALGWAGDEVAKAMGIESDSPLLGEVYQELLMLSHLSSVPDAALRAPTDTKGHVGLPIVRARLGLNIGQMADALGVPRNTYSQWERGVRSMPPIALTAIRWLYLGRVVSCSPVSDVCLCGNPLDCSDSDMCLCGQPMDTCICG